MAVSASLVNVVVLFKIRPYDQLPRSTLGSHVSCMIVTAAMAVAAALRAHGDSAAMRATFEGLAHHVGTRTSETRAVTAMAGNHAATAAAMAVAVAAHLHLHGLLLHHHHGLLLCGHLLHCFHLRHGGRLHLHGLHRNLLHSLHGHGLALSFIFRLRPGFLAAASALYVDLLLNNA